MAFFHLADLENLHDTKQKFGPIKQSENDIQIWGVEVSCKFAQHGKLTNQLNYTTRNIVIAQLWINCRERTHRHNW
jgi:hypothetical protein